MTKPATYLSFLVRLWHEAAAEDSGPGAEWQGEIEHIQSGQRWEFSSLDELLSFLRRMTESPAHPGSMMVK